MTNFEWLRTLSPEEIAPMLVHCKDEIEQDDNPFGFLTFLVYYVPWIPDDDTLYGGFEDAVEAALQWLKSDDPSSRECASLLIRHALNNGDEEVLQGSREPYI